MLTQCNYSSFECTVHVLQVLVCTPHLLQPKFSDSIYHMSSEHTLPKTTISDLSTFQHWHSPVLFERTLHQPLGAEWKEGKPSSFLLPLSSPSLQEEPLVKFSHSLGLAALSLFCEERYHWYFKATSNLISLPILGRGGQTGTALFAQLWDWFCSSRSKSCTLQPLVTQGRKIACEAQSRAKWWWKTCNAPALGWYSSLHS